MPKPSDPRIKSDSVITETVLREQKKLGNFIQRRVGDVSEADDILQDVLSEFVEAYRLPEPIEQIGAWLYRVARNRIVDRFRKNKEQSLDALIEEDEDHEYRLDLVLPDPQQGPEALYARSVLLNELQLALDELPDNQREIFIAHELEGMSFKEMAAQSGVSQNTLLARRRYAVLYLRNRLQDIVDEFD